MKSLPAFSVRNALVVNLLSIFVLAAGALTLVNMRRDAFPNFSFDLVSIQTYYPGATPEEVEKLITHPIEEELKRVSDIDELNSVSAEGYSYVIVKIDPDASNKPQVVTDIQQAVDRVTDFPADLEEQPTVYEIKTEDAPIIEVTLSGPLGRKGLQEQAELLEDRLEDIPDVSSVVRGGWREKQIWVELDLAKLTRHRVAIEEVVRAVRANNVNIAGGTLDTGSQEFLVRTNHEFEEPEEINEIVVRANEVGNVLRVRDVGLAQWRFEDTDVINRVNGNEAVRLVVVKKRIGDAINLVSSVEEVVDEFKKSAPKELELSYINDLSYYIKRRLGILLNNGWIGMIFVITALFLLLSNRVAVWTIVGLPVAMGAALWVMGMLDLTVNLISMFGLIMVIGILVDDAIVVAENIYRYMEEGYPPREAAIKGAQEVARPVTTTILTTVVAFLPLAFMSGIMGKFIRAIPYVVIITLIVSLIEALMVLPSHLAEFGGTPRKKAKQKKPRWTPFTVMCGGYLAVLGRALRFHKTVTVGSVLLLALGIWYGLTHIKLQLFPSRGIEIFFVRAETDIGTSLEETEKLFAPIEKVVGELPKEELDDYVTVIGLIQEDPNDPFSVRGSHVGQIIVYLTPEPDRDRSADEIAEQIRKKAQDVQGLNRVWIDQVKPGPPQGKPVAVRIRGVDYEVMTEISQKVQAYLNTLPGVKDVDDDYDRGKDEIRVVVDTAAASTAGLTPADVGRTVRWAFEGEVASIIRKGDEETDVVVRLDEKSRATKKTFESLYVENPQRFHVPLPRVARLESTSGIAAIKHFDRHRTLTVTSNIDEDTTSSVEINDLLKKKFKDIPTAYPGYLIEFGGEYEETQESMDDLRRAFILAAFLIFLILASSFNSLAQPITVMLAIPYGLLSAIFALGIHGQPLSFLAFLGMVGLSGVTVNDSIILIDFINKRRTENGDLKAAIMEAGKMRFRPVLLTSITTVFGLGPIAYGIGGLDPFLVPMALVITWGIALGTILTLTLIPCAYATIDGVACCFKRKKPTVAIDQF